MLTLIGNSIPARLQLLPQPPKQLYVEGDLATLLSGPCIAIVGSRKLSPYGRDVTRKLAMALAKQGIVIISGLAYGVDSVAHQAALDAGGPTIAVLPSPLEAVYPAGHRPLARQLLASGGALVSEYPAGTISFAGNFVARNRIIAGLADATLLTEAALKSGSLHTARFTLELGREVLAVPGNITSATSEGTNNLIRTGAVPVLQVDDILHAMKLPVDTPKRAVKGDTPSEQLVLDLMGDGIDDGETLQLKSELPIDLFNQCLTMLEITGKIRALGANRWTL